VAKDDQNLSGEESAEGSPGRQFITALARGLDVLGAFRPNDPPLSNQELARRTGLPRPTISRITLTLTELGYLNYHERFGCYELGGSALVLGHVARTNFNALERIRPLTERLAQNCNANVGIGTRERLNMVYLDVVHGPSRIGLRFEIGSQIPIFQTAMGRAYLAGSSESETGALVKQMQAQAHDKSDEPARIIAVAREEYARLGFCVSAGDWHNDIHGIAIPIVIPDLGGTLALNVGAPAYLLPKSRLLEEVGPELVRTAAEMADILNPLPAALGEAGKPPKRRSNLIAERVPQARSKPRRNQA